MQERYTDLRLLVQCIQKSSLASDELNDEVCMAAIKVLANQTKEVRFGCGLGVVLRGFFAGTGNGQEFG